ncbi:doxx family protein [Robiginitalea sp. M366]|uniref:doxx family protein n=1 Tax=Robiginitalea aestuariiviva TaxID=3036903 RepID=UPI00240D29D7|nr:doxx family protein [Robiginitalea aestuariiviva]MDG1572445.1 doxx family protein [Robiginitalea aestuariiviva]
MRILSTSKTNQAPSFGFIARGLGLVYLWFGALKFFPGLSPAEALAGDTIEALTFGTISAGLGLVLLALWEFAIGILLMVGICRRCALTAAIVHIVLTFTPLFFFPELCFTQFPYGLTLVGQYIIKNVVFLGVMVAMLRRLP